MLKLPEQKLKLGPVEYGADSTGQGKQKAEIAAAGLWTTDL
jgi:hypothetical protein